VVHDDGEDMMWYTRRFAGLMGYSDATHHALHHEDVSDVLVAEETLM
jgi:hypothetical protein